MAGATHYSCWSRPWMYLNTAITQFKVETQHYQIETVILENASAVVISIAKQKGVKLCCRLRNEQGESIFCKKLTRGQTKLYAEVNLRKWTEGVYLLEIEDGVTPITQTIRKPNFLKTEAINPISSIGE